VTKPSNPGHAGESVHGHVFRLLSAHARNEGVLLDLGCGLGAVAASCAEIGLDYLGVGAEPDGLAELAGRGFSTAVVDLGEQAALLQRLEEVLAGRSLAAIVALDLIERLTRPAELLAVLGEVARKHPGAPLVASVANVSHFDLAAKLLSGRWDVTSEDSSTSARSRTSHPARSSTSCRAPAGSRSRRTTWWPATATSTSPRL